MFESAVSIVAVIFALIATGFVAQRRGWLGANAQTVLSRLTLRIGMPGLVVSNIFSNYDRAMLVSGAVYLLVPLLVMTLMYSGSAYIAKIARVPDKRRGVFRALFTFGNTVFVGMPVCRAIFGDGAVQSVLFYYLVNTIFWWIIGAPRVAADGGVKTKGALSNLMTPPLLSCLISVPLVLIGFQPPQIVMTVAGYLGNMVTPLSMLFVGTTLQTMIAQGIRWEKGYGWMIAARCVIGPLLCLPLCYAFGLPKEVLGVFFVQSGMPAQTQSCLWAQENGADAGYAAGGITLSTLCGLVAIPVYAFLLGYL